MTQEVSDFSLVSLIALVLFLAIMIPRALFHLAEVTLAGVIRKRVEADRWLIAIALSFILCAGLGLATGLFNARAKTLVDQSEAVTLAFLLFAGPAVLQVLRAWRNSHAKRVKALSHGLVALAVLSLPASMAIPTAALMQAAGAPLPGQAAVAVSADNPAAAIADVRFFTDNEVANDPEDYPIAAWMRANLTVQWPQPPDTMRGEAFYRQIPTYTGFWLDQTTEALSFEATDTFGVIVSRITHVRANWAFSLAVFLYKLLCGLILVAVTYDAVLRPAIERARPKGRRST